MRARGAGGGREGRRREVFSPWSTPKDAWWILTDTQADMLRKGRRWEAADIFPKDRKTDRHNRGFKWLQDFRHIIWHTDKWIKDWNGIIVKCRIYAYEAYLMTHLFKTCLPPFLPPSCMLTRAHTHTHTEWIRKQLVPRIDGLLILNMPLLCGLKLVGSLEWKKVTGRGGGNTMSAINLGSDW